MHACVPQQDISQLKPAAGGTGSEHNREAFRGSETQQRGVQGPTAVISVRS